MLKKALTIVMAVTLVACFMAVALPAYAKVTAEEAERLKKDLTPFGAEKAGNADGTIPAWTGGLTEFLRGFTMIRRKKSFTRILTQRIRFYTPSRPRIWTSMRKN